MTLYRVKQRFYPNGKTDFEVQKKVWFIPFWYNFNNVDGAVTGFYNTLDEAKIAIEANRGKISHVIIPIE